MTVKILAKTDEGYEVYDEELLEECFSKPAFMTYCMTRLQYENPYVYHMLMQPAPAGIYTKFSKIAESVWKMISVKKLANEIETLAKTVSCKTAWQALINGVEVGTGKRTAILPEKILNDIRILKLDAYISDFQKMVVDKVLSVQEVETLLLTFKIMHKLKLASLSDFDYCFSYYLGKLVARKVNVKVMMEKTLQSLFTLGNIDRKDLEDIVNYRWTFTSLFRHYADSILMMPEEETKNTSTYSSNNIPHFHIITSRNVKILLNPREEEFTLAAERLRKLKWNYNDKYMFVPMQTEKELFYIGERYNNCLPTYRDKIIDEGAIVMNIYAINPDGSLADCPEVVFEVTGHLDVCQVKTFNDVDVTDYSMLQLIRLWKDSKRYLLSNGRTVYREPDED